MYLVDWQQFLNFGYGGQKCAQIFKVIYVDWQANSQLVIGDKSVHKFLKWNMWIDKQILNFGYRGQKYAQIFKVKYVDWQGNSQMVRS